MAQEKVHLPELNERMTKKLRVQDEFEDQVAQTEDQFEDVNINEEDNNYAPASHFPTSTTSTTTTTTTTTSTSNYYNNNDNNVEENKEMKEEDIDFGILLAEFSQLTGEDDSVKILAILEKHNWNLDAAVSNYLDDQDSYNNPSPYHNTHTSITSKFGMPNYSHFNNNNDDTTTNFTNYDEYTKNYDYNSRDEISQLPRAGMDNDDDGNYNDDDESTYANPDTRQDVSEDETEAYLKANGFPTTSLDRYDEYYQTTAATSTTKFDPSDYSALCDTLEDYKEKEKYKEEEEDNRKGYKSNISYDPSAEPSDYDIRRSNNNNNNYNDDYNYRDNSNNNTTSSTSNYTNNNNNNNNNTNNINNNEVTSFDAFSDCELGYNTKYFCKLAGPGSEWTKTPIIPGRTSLKLICVNELCGLIITYERLIELLHLSEMIDCYAFHQLVLGTAARWYYQIRGLPGYHKLSSLTHQRIKEFMSDSWD